jgi:thiamine-phosphate pyrophosphorylase
MQMYEPTPFRLPRFYPILDTAVLAARNCPARTAAEGLSDAGVRILQYRHKENWSQANYDEAKQIATLCHDNGILFVVNDRADFARLLKAAVHLGQDDLPPAAARRIVSDEVMGFSTHNKQQLLDGDQEQVEYLSIGPIFPTSSKLKPDPVVGLERLRQLRPLTAKPLTAIGGITLENVREVFAAGVDSAAVIGAVLPEKCDRKSVKARATEWLRMVA